MVQVPENIHTHPNEGDNKLEIVSGMESQKAKILKGKYKAQLEIPPGRWGVIWILSGTTHCYKKLEHIQETVVQTKLVKWSKMESL